VRCDKVRHWPGGDRTSGRVHITTLVNIEPTSTAPENTAPGTTTAGNTTPGSTTLVNSALGSTTAGNM
jgi:hypothetical protein